MQGAAVLLVLCLAGIHSQSTDEVAAQAWVNQYNTDAQNVLYDSVVADWAYNTNITEFNNLWSIEEAGKVAAFDKAKADEADQLWAWQGFQNEALKREFGQITNKGYSVLPAADFDRMSALNSAMKATYSTARVCNKPGDVGGECYPLDPDLTALMASSRDWDELLWAWEGWRDESGRNMPDQYEEFAGLLNQAAVLNSFGDNGEFWRSTYEDPDFRNVCEGLWLQLKPLYDQLHAHTRKKLRETYPGDEWPATNQIPAHILGNMWAQSWVNVEDIMRPHTDTPGLDVTDEMIRQNYTVRTIFDLSEDFFKSLGLDEMNQGFWDNSMMEKPIDREVVCHASAWDFMRDDEFRIKQCTTISTGWIITTHHEMGHIQYFMEYKNQPVKFRTGANPGFHEAIGDVMALSVSTPDHMKLIGLFNDTGVDLDKMDLNFLMQEGLKKIAFVPFGYLIDQWRWDLFAGDFDRSEYNSKWWEARCKYQGLSPPVTRSAGGDFDAGAKYHVPGNTPYIRYFVSYILQYQFHKAMCDASGHVGPLHRCDIYGSTEAGANLINMMELGASQHWADALEQLTGSRVMDVQPMLDYFQPLLDYLVTENAGETIGWDEACPAGSIVP